MSIRSMRKWHIICAGNFNVQKTQTENSFLKKLQNIRSQSAPAVAMSGT